MHVPPPFWVCAAPPVTGPFWKVNILPAASNIPGPWGNVFVLEIPPGCANRLPDKRVTASMKDRPCRIVGRVRQCSTQREISVFDSNWSFLSHYGIKQVGVHIPARRQVFTDLQDTRVPHERVVTRGTAPVVPETPRIRRSGKYRPRRHRRPLGNSIRPPTVALCLGTPARNTSSPHKPLAERDGGPLHHIKAGSRTDKYRRHVPRPALPDRKSVV